MDPREACFPGLHAFTMLHGVRQPFLSYPVGVWESGEEHYTAPLATPQIPAARGQLSRCGTKAWLSEGRVTYLAPGPWPKGLDWVSWGSWSWQRGDVWSGLISTAGRWGFWLEANTISWAVELETMKNVSGEEELGTVHLGMPANGSLYLYWADYQHPISSYIKQLEDNLCPKWCNFKMVRGCLGQFNTL